MAKVATTRWLALGLALAWAIPAAQAQQPPIKLGELNSFDDREAKVQNIALHIGRRPILAFGNSDGDLAMLRYTKTGPGPRLALLIHHDDHQREVAYDRDFTLSPLVEALDRAADYGITLAPLIARQIFDAIRTLNRQDGLTVLIVEQNANHALKLAHRGYVMVNGLITLSGTGSELLQRPEIRAAYLEGGRRD